MVGEKLIPLVLMRTNLLNLDLLKQYLSRIRTNLCILLTYATIVATILELSKDLQGLLHLLDAILETIPRSTLIILYRIRNVISFSIAPWQMKVLTITQ